MMDIPRRSDSCVVAQARKRIILGSPFLLADLESVQKAAIVATRRLYRLDMGDIGKRIDRLLQSACPPEHRLDLIRALVESDPRNGDYWQHVWPSLHRHYQLELGTGLLMRRIEVRPALRDLALEALREDVRIDIVCNWSKPVLKNLAWAVAQEMAMASVGSEPFNPIDRGSLGKGPKGFWIGQAGQGDSEARRRGHQVVTLTETASADELDSVYRYIGRGAPGLAYGETVRMGSSSDARVFAERR